MTNEVYKGADVFFRLLNLGIFIALIAYYFRRTIIGTIRNHLFRKKSTLETISKQTVELKSEHAELKGQLKQQEMLYRELTNKIEQWRLGITKDQEQHKAHCTQQATALDERLDKQYKAYIRHKAMRHLIPLAFDATTKDLQEIFRDPQAARLYNEKAIGEL